MSRQRQKVVVFVDDSPESQRALEKLAAADVEVTAVRASGTPVPSAKIGNTLYAGMWGIDFLAHGLGKKRAPEHTE